MLDKRLLDILVCPKCKGDLEYVSKDGEMLLCHGCRKGYPVRDGIPVMLIEDAVDLDSEERKAE